MRGEKILLVQKSGNFLKKNSSDLYEKESSKENSFFREISWKIKFPCTQTQKRNNSEDENQKEKIF